MRKQTAVILFVWVAVLGFARGAAAQTGLFFDEFGGGYKASAMGQAFTAVADDYSAAYYNPAGLTQVRGIFENATGYLYAKPNVSARFPTASGINILGQPSSRGMFTGIASSLDIDETVRVYPWFRRFAFGLISWMNLPEIMQYHAGPVASRPHFLRHDMRFQLMATVISLGFEIMPWLSVGAGIIPSIDSTADQDNFAAVNSRDDRVMGIRLSIHQTAKLFVVPVLGVLAKPPVPILKDLDLSLGVSFRGENKSHNGKGPLNQVIGEENVYGDPIFGIYYPPVLTINLVSFAPRQVTGGLAFKPSKQLLEILDWPIPVVWTLSYDMTWKQWSQYETYLEQKPFPAFDDTFTQRVGTEFAWMPSFSPRFLRMIRKICFRGGYYYEPTPVRHLEWDSPLVRRLSQGQIPADNIFDADLDVFSLGLCVTLAGKKMEHDLEFFTQYHHLRDYTTAAYMDSVYAFQNHLPVTVRDDYIPVEIGGSVWSIGGSYTIRF
jgi:long-chain fatty acid transport protein